MNTFEIEEVIEEVQVRVHQQDTEGEEASLLRIQEIKSSWKLNPHENQHVVKKKKKNTVSTLFYVSITLAFLGTFLFAGLAGITKTVSIIRRHHRITSDKYSVALEKALMFFDAQRSGKLPELYGVSWRGDSCLNDGQATFSKDVSGGYYDSGNAIKSTLHTSFAMTMLSWSVIEYNAKYKTIGQLDHTKDIIKWGTDYLLKTFDLNARTVDRVIKQVGDGNSNASQSPNDLYCWMRPEDIDYIRPVVECENCPDVAAEMAAALASASLVFKDDRKYSSKLVRGAKMVFEFSRSQIGRNTSNNYWDEVIWAATWLFYATRDYSYLKFATSKDVAEYAGAFGGGPTYGVLSKDNKLPGAQVLLTRLRLSRWGKQYPYEDLMKEYHNQTSVFICSYLDMFTHFKRTKGGLVKLILGAPQPLQYAVNAAFLAKVFHDYLEAEKLKGWVCGPYFIYYEALIEFAGDQVDYILGKNPRRLSYVVGYGNVYPQQVHHRGASIPNDGKKYDCEGGWTWRDSPKPNPNTIVGAMVAGPDENDGFQDVRAYSNYTEPTVIGNAGLVVALVALSRVEPLLIDKKTMNSVIFFVPPPPPPPPPWQP